MVQMTEDALFVATWIAGLLSEDGCRRLASLIRAIERQAQGLPRRRPEEQEKVETFDNGVASVIEEVQEPTGEGEEERAPRRRRRRSGFNPSREELQGM